LISQLPLVVGSPPIPECYLTGHFVWDWALDCKRFLTQGIAKLGFIPLPSALHARTADDTYFTEIVDEADLLSSFAISIREAAYRRDPATIALHVAELRMTGLALVKAYRAIQWAAPATDEVAG
jgi:hypothetical protein